ncbi:MAG: arginine--tRNA ligase, partial [Verrucomicrobiota bacterium]
MLASQLESRLHAAVAAIVPGADLRRVLVRPATEVRFGDYQCNALMALAREHRTNPRQLAADVAARLDVSEWCTRVEVAGAGFLNFHVRPEAFGAALARAVQEGTLFFTPTPEPRTVVIDFSSPNVAKPMHVGHIRSTLLGAALARILRLLGHQVITDNHLGDWGTQFGMLLVGWKTELDPAALVADPFAELERVYKKVNASAQVEPAVLEAARAELVRLQSGDPENRAIWQEMIRLSQGQFDTIYRRLGVAFDHTLGESFYNPWLGPLVERLVAAGVARESQGAIAVLSDRALPPKEDPFLVQRDGEWQDDPFIVRKSDGAANYATTDLATLEYRLNAWRADEVLYVVGAPQRPHFDKLFAAFRRWQPEAAARVKLVHVWFGSILGEDGKPFRTRSGDTVKLAGLLDEAEERAGRLVDGKRPDLGTAERAEI